MTATVPSDRGLARLVKTAALHRAAVTAYDESNVAMRAYRPVATRLFCAAAL